MSTFISLTSNSKKNYPRQSSNHSTMNPSTFPIYQSTMSEKDTTMIKTRKHLVFCRLLTRDRVPVTFNFNFRPIHSITRKKLLVYETIHPNTSKIADSPGETGCSRFEKYAKGNSMAADERLSTPGGSYNRKVAVHGCGIERRFANIRLTRITWPESRRSL